ncbi:SUMF1/EgtB/PvdO family nonheme iron enzyme [Haliscomenobacter hydrossis]|uniref:Sulphatase-modifying factor protein n=1 Tax=Haliscomenobacter hydrossis (strain ATCC 27775 / DSM 1100 / LMG 10767 / O) TaxID=760192 RepID=F4KRB9_HALH1|nr:SUMF1/EgtB/PvdO family nonheme iron enzyme [Haliscomenobacter hydrossis]AEE54306.1 Sulphatase-modifying factor protein [Haliscomenobacter hydrossis DSM 1100]
MTKEEIKKFIAEDQTTEVLDQLLALVNAYLLVHPKDQTASKIQHVLLVNAGKFRGLNQERVLGILKREDEQTTTAQVQAAMLYVIEELPEKVWQTKTESDKTSVPHSEDFDFDIFLSFSSKDRESARLIWEMLRGLGFRIFLSDEALKAHAGMSFLDRIDWALRRSQHFLLLCTPTAVQSQWVKLECETFFTRFHLAKPSQRRFFIFERGGKKWLGDVYQNLQTLDEIQTLVEILRAQLGQAGSVIPMAIGHAFDAQNSNLQQTKPSIEQRLGKEQEKLEKAAAQAISNPTITRTLDFEVIKKAKLLQDFYQTYGENASTLQFLKLHSEVVREFGAISETDLNDLIEEIHDKEIKRNEIIASVIPQTIKTFVADHKGKWSRRDELFFLDELSNRYGKILDKPALAVLLDDARVKFQAILQDFVLIKGGEFMMGAPDEEADARADEKPQHQVRLTDFYLSKYPTTLAQFEEFILATGYQTDADQSGGSDFWNGKNWELQAGVNWTYDVHGAQQKDKQHPVIHVSWNDARAYCDWLEQRLSLPIRLPREAEWEYACRAGTTTPFNTGANLTTVQANYDGNYPYADFPKGTYLGRTSPIGLYPPNAWGLYDMHGNVLEWCEDWYSETYYNECKKQGVVADPEGSSAGSARVLRGGSWLSFARHCRTAYRFWNGSVYRSAGVGFRPVWSL